MNKVVVTGVAGFVASRLTRRLASKGHAVVGIDITPKAAAWRLKKTFEEFAPRIEYQWRSVFDISSTLKDPQISAVIHTAAIADVPFAIASPKRTWEENTGQTLAIMDAIRLEKERGHDIYMVQMSSESAIGESENLPIPENVPLLANGAYGASKAGSELIVRGYSKGYGLSSCIIRSGTLFGPESRMEQVIPIFLRKALSRQKIKVEGGSQSRDFNYVENLIDALVGVLERTDLIPSAEVFHIASGQEHSIIEVANHCAAAAHAIVPWNVPKAEKIERVPPRPGEENSPRLVLDISKAKEMLGYAPKVSFSDGIAETAAWIASVMGVK